MKAFLSNQKMSFLLRSICFLFLFSSFQNTFVSSTQHLCHSDQRDALLDFKNEFSIYSDDSSSLKTKSWVNNSDCCSWDGITCDAKSGKVIGLDLSDSFLQGQLNSNSSLFRLHHLRDLNLAYNNFNSSPIFLLSFVNISSEIPHEFSNLRSLRSLNLYDCNLFGEFPSSVLLIPTLQSINLGENPNLRGNLPVFRENSSLLEMTIVNTAFSGPIPDSISSLKHLTSLTLSDSYFSGKIPFSLGNLSHLSYLELSSNFVGEIPSSIGNLKQLTSFDVSDNNLSGNLPASIGNLKQLTSFDVSNNNLSGNLPASILNFTHLRSLYLNSNQFTGCLPPIISQISKLEYFIADNNSFTGAILTSLLKIPSLTSITLTYNQFSDFTGIGNISLLPNLKVFHIHSKNYNKDGLVDLNVFSPLRNLYLSGIPLSTANTTSNSDFPSHLVYLGLSGCNITEFPEFIRYGINLWKINLSNNKIKGQVPDWLWRLPMLSSVNLSNNSLSGFNGSSKDSSESRLMTLDLSSNAFQGPLFIPPPRTLLDFLGSKNNFTGEIPRSICGLSFLDVLDLSDNNLHGTIPRCLETMMSSLVDLNLRNNSLSGSVPEIFMNAKNLISLDVSHNQMEGILPVTLSGCSALKVLNVGSNKINDLFPFQLNSLHDLQVLILRSNKFHGTLLNADGVWFGFPQLKIIDVSHNDFLGTLPSDYFLNWTVMSSKRDNNMKPEYIQGYDYISLVLMSKGVSMEMERILTIYTAVDFSGNQLHGQIPDSVGLLRELRILNLSSNAFTGHIPSSLANLTSLESLDLSQNKISGEIPPELGTLSSLEWINVSHNKLVGSIPQGTQFQRQKCSSYEGNLGLNIKDVCGNIKVPTPPQPEQLDIIEEEEEESVSWVAAGLGFASGVVFGLAMGYIVASYKHQWFMKTFDRIKQLSTRTR